METKANYVLIGAATLAGIVASLGFFLWFAHFSINRQFDYYDILFEQVSGLSNAADVQFNGITVGRVVEIAIPPEDAARVRVRIEVNAGTPINKGTVATLQAQGVTGVSFVSLSGGDSSQQPLEPDPQTGLPVIPSRPSTLDTLLQTTPELLREARSLLQGLTAFTGKENQERVSQILDNLATASGGLEEAIADVRTIAGSVRDGVGQIAAFTGKLDGISQQLTQTLAKAETTFTSATGAFDEAKGTLTSGTAALDSAKLAFDEAGTLIQTRGPQLVDRYEALADSARGTSDELRVQMGDLATRLDAAADLAADRLRDLEAPIAAAGPAIASLDSAAAGIDGMVRGDGAALVAEARTALTSANRILETDAPGIVADLRSAAATVNRVVDQFGKDGAALPADAAATLEAAREAFGAATARLQQLEPAIGTAEQAIASANAAFGSADRMLSTDIEPVVSDLRATIARFDTALAGVAADLPAITADVRSAAASASQAARRFDGMMATSAAPIEGFAAQGLPQFTRLAAEARALVTQLEQLTRRIERDPARFFLGGQAPEYRR